MPSTPLNDWPKDRLSSFEEFWPCYLGEHRSPASRALHYAGTTMGVGTLAVAALTLNPAWLLLTPIVGYGPAWVGHFVIEKNRPASFRYPLWSLRGDFKMLGLALRGKMGEEMKRYYGSARPAKNAPRVDLQNGAATFA
jgi:hypothetical protein